MLKLRLFVYDLVRPTLTLASPQKMITNDYSRFLNFIDRLLNGDNVISFSIMLKKGKKK